MDALPNEPVCDKLLWMRLFIALCPPGSVRDALFDLMDGVAEARWQDDEQLHLTLRFVGEVDGRAAEDLADAVGGLRASAPSVKLSGVGAFGGRGRAGALWAGLAPREPLLALHRKVDQMCVRLGFEPERRAFLPHLTLARLPRNGGGREAERWLARHAGLTSEPFTFDRAILYRSHLGRAGAAYEPLVETRLLPTG